jgi:hypothetical protein
MRIPDLMPATRSQSFSARGSPGGQHGQMPAQAIGQPDFAKCQTLCMGRVGFHQCWQHCMATGLVCDCGTDRCVPAI